MNIKDWFNQVAYLKFVSMEGIPDKDISKSWLSKFDDSHITFEGLEGDMSYLAEHEITEELTHGVGFSPKEQKWYGWSHRAIYGFGIGSTCKKGDCHYIGSSTIGRGEWIAKTMEDAKQMAIDFNHGVS